MKSLYRIENLKFSYQQGNQRVEALHGIDLEIPQQAFTCLSGPSGSGKTTLLNLLGLIESVQEGTLLFDGMNLAEASEDEKNRIRRFQLGFIFQSFQLFPVLTAQENVEYFLSRQGVASKERTKRAADALAAVGLSAHAGKRPLEMSGGQRQRVAIARALAKTPRVIIADEPTASLDQKTGREIMEILRTLNEAHQVTVIVSSHDPMVQQFARDRIEIRDGRLAC